MRTCEKIQKLKRLYLIGRHDSADVAIDYGEESPIQDPVVADQIPNPLRIGDCRL